MLKTNALFHYDASKLDWYPEPNTQETFSDSFTRETITINGTFRSRKPRKRRQQERMVPLLLTLLLLQGRRGGKKKNKEGGEQKEKQQMKYASAQMWRSRWSRARLRLLGIRGGLGG